MNQMFTNFLQILKPRLQRDLDEEDMLVAQHVRNSIHQKATSSSPKLKKESQKLVIKAPSIQHRKEEEVFPVPSPQKLYQPRPEGVVSFEQMCRSTQ